MNKPSALILCAVDPSSNPRPNRMIHWLKDVFDVKVVGRYDVHIDGVETIGLFSSKSDDIFNLIDQDFRQRIVYWFKYFFYFFTKQYEDIIWSTHGKAKRISDEIAEEHFDLIVSHDLTLLPLAFKLKQETTRILFDAREFYPRNFDDLLKWRLLVKPVNIHLCRKYLFQCDKIITVSDGLVKEYKKEFGVQSDVVMSLPHFWDLHPVMPGKKKIRMIYHGYANKSRETERMIELMDYVDERFLLDLMLVEIKDKYSQKIASMVQRRKNVRIVPPVAMQEIVPVINKYDIGLFLCPPTNFNLKYTLPNKLFEFIQARLAVAIGPSIEMKKIVEEYDCGEISADFEPRSLAKKLNELTADKILYYKKRSHYAAKSLNADVNGQKVRRIIQNLLNNDMK